MKNARNAKNRSGAVIAIAIAMPVVAACIFDSGGDYQGGGRRPQGEQPENADAGTSSGTTSGGTDSGGGDTGVQIGINGTYAVTFSYSTSDCAAFAAGLFEKDTYTISTATDGTTTLAITGDATACLNQSVSGQSLTINCNTTNINPLTLTGSISFTSTGFTGNLSELVHLDGSTCTVSGPLTANKS